MEAITENVIRELCYIISYKWGKKVSYKISSCDFSKTTQGDILIDGEESVFYWLICDCNGLVDDDKEMIVGGHMFNETIKFIMNNNAIRLL